MLLLPLPLPAPQDVAETFVTAPRSAATATASAIAVQTITSEELAKTGERSLPRAIGKASGLFVQETNLGGGAPIIQGLLGNQILIVIDGVRLNDATTRGGPNQSLNSIDPAIVERVEVIRAPTSVLYGSDAVGGAILVWTKNRPAGDRVEPSADALRWMAGFSADYQSTTDGTRYSFDVSGATERDGFLGVGSVWDWEDLESADGTVDNTGFHGQGYFGSWEHLFGSHSRLRLTASRTRDFDVPRTDRLNTGFGQTQPADAEHEFQVQDRQRYQLTYDDTESGFSDAMQVRVSFRKYIEERQIRATGSTSRRLETDDVETVGVGIDWRKKVGGAQLFTWGLDVDFDDVDATRDNVNINTGVSTPAAGSFAPKSEYLATGVFIQDEIFAFEPFAVTAGLRYSYFEFGFENNVAFPAPIGGPAVGEDVDGDFDALTGSLGIARDIASGVRVTGTIGQAYRAPNLADLARNATFAAGNELPNSNLDPEESLAEELALDVTRTRWNASVSVFHNDVTNQVGRRLVSDPTPANPGSGDEIYQRINSGDAEYYGAAARYERVLGGTDSPYGLGVYVAYLEGTFKDVLDPLTGLKSSEEPATRVPPLNGYVSLTYEPVQPWYYVNWADLSLWWATEQGELSPFDKTDPRIDPNGTDGWGRLDFECGGPIGDVGSGATWTLGVLNILDESYRIHGTGFDAPGRGLIAGLRVSI